MADGLAGAGDGSTPLHPDDQEGLIPAYISTRGELNEAEQRNILTARRKHLRRPPETDEVLDDLWLRHLHQDMFGEVWEWAGTYRRRTTNIGIDWQQIPIAVTGLVGDVRTWLDGGRDGDESAVDMHRRLGEIHPFPDGNGRHARFTADLLAVSLGREPFSWGRSAERSPKEVRTEYLTALRDADRGDLQPLVDFARN